MALIERQVGRKPVGVFFARIRQVSPETCQELDFSFAFDDGEIAV
jgi:hypothetical protein